MSVLPSNVVNQVNSRNPKDTHFGVVILEFIESHLQVKSTNWMIVLIFKIREFITTKISKINVKVS